MPNPAPKTESARKAQSSFYCTLCSKQYSRMNELQAHESSYDHLHRQRMVDMRKLQRDVSALEKSRKPGRKSIEEGGLVTIKLETSGKSVRKGGFRNAFAPIAPPESSSVEYPEIAPEPEKSNPDSQGLDYYDPCMPTDCFEGCASRA